MAISKILTPALRFFQLLFSAVALALLIVLAKGQVGGSVPVSTGYCAFAAAFAILASLIGISAVFIDRIPTKVVAVIDLIAVLATLAGGVSYAYFLRNANCSRPDTLWQNNILNCGTAKFNGEKVYLCVQEGPDEGPNQLKKRCGLAKAGDAFLFITCVLSIVAVVFSVVTIRRNRGSTGSNKRTIF